MSALSLNCNHDVVKQLGCKVLQDFNAQMVRGDHDALGELDRDPEDDNGPTTAQGQHVTVAFHYVIQ